MFIDQDRFKHCVTCGHIQYPRKSADIRAVLAETVVIEYTQREGLSTAFLRTQPF